MNNKRATASTLVVGAPAVKGYLLNNIYVYKQSKQIKIVQFLREKKKISDSKK